MERIKITMLGISGSGKTSFFSGLYHSLIAGTVKSKDKTTMVNLIGLDDDGGIDRLTGLSTAQIMEQYKISNVMGNREGTWEISDFNFKLEIIDRQSKQYEVPIHIYDYRGGLLQVTRDEDEKEEAEILMTKVINSHVLLIMADAIQLTNNAHNSVRRKEKTGADKINTIMKSLIKSMRKESVTVLLLLTKSDSEKIDQSYKMDGYKKMRELAKETFDSVFAYSELLKKERNWNFGIVPITAVGEGNVNTRYIEGASRFICELKNDADPQQKNIDNALLYSVYQTLKNRMHNYERKIEECTAVIQQGKKFGFDFFERRQAAENMKVEKSKLLKENEVCAKSAMILNEAFAGEFACINV